MSEYSFQAFSLKALSLLWCTFLYSLICASFECLVMSIKRCINLLNDKRPFTFNLISQPGRLRSVWISWSSARLYYGSMIDLRCLPSGSASSIIFASFLSIAGNEILLLLSSPGVLRATSFLPIMGYDAIPSFTSWADNLSTSSGFIEATLLCLSSCATESSSPNTFLKFEGLSLFSNFNLSFSTTSFSKSSKYF